MSSATERRLSIASLLTLLITLACALLIALTSAILYKRFAALQVEEERRVLSSKLYQAEAELEGVGPEGDTEEEEFGEIQRAVDRENASGANPIFVEVLDPSGRSRMQTQGMRELLDLDPPFPSPTPNLESVEVVYWSFGDRHFALASAWVDLPLIAERRLLRAVLERTESQRGLADLARTILLIVLAGAAVSALIAVAITRRTLRPLGAMTSAIRRVDAQRLDRRMALERFPRELEPLAHEFDAMQLRLHDSFDRLSRFSADLAHELRTPVTNLIGEAEVALSRPRSSGEYREVLESSLEELARLARIIDSLLFIARADESQAIVQAESLDLRTEAESVAEFYDLVAAEKNLRIEVQGEGKVAADRTLARRAIGNILSNAIRYSGEEGTITISVETAGEVVRVRVIDRGPGIAPSHLARVFDRFYRADDARSRYPGGSGLGLSIVRSIMSLHSGSVTIESTEGAGTTATLVFPTTPDSRQDDETVIRP